MKKILCILLLLLLYTPVFAGSSSVLVIAYSDRRAVAVSLRQEADFVSMPLTISSDQKEPKQRFSEMKAAKAMVMKQAEAHERIQVHAGPVSLSAKPTSKLASLTSYGPSSEVRLYLLVPLKGQQTDVFACATEIRKFLDGITLPAKAEYRLGQIQLAVDNPGQYRDQLLTMIAGDVAKTRELLKSKGTVNVSGLEGPVLVRQADDRHVELFINYSMSIDMIQD